MKHKVLFLLAIISLSSFFANAQRGVRIGYIDTEYILQNVPEYQVATSQLEKKVQGWKVEIEQRLKTIEEQKKQLNSESVLLTKELYEERMEDIGFEEAEILAYQQKRFGPDGDLMIQKRQLVQPIQDQIFSAVQEIAGNKKYDFIFDKSADVVMLYSAERYDISELVIRSITRTSKRTQAQNRAERKAAEKEDVVPVINDELEARQKALEEKQTARKNAIEARKAAQKAKRDSLKAQAEAKRKGILDKKAEARNAAEGNNATEDGTTPKTAAEIAKEKRAQKLKDREARKKALEEKRLKILADKEKARLEREAQRKAAAEAKKKAREDAEANED